MMKVCKFCNGQGFVQGDICHDCGGEGVDGEVTFTVNKITRQKKMTHEEYEKKRARELSNRDKKNSERLL